MTWRLLQEFEPTWDWQISDLPILGDVALRVEQDWSYEGSFPGKAYCLLALQYPDGAFHSFRRIYPYRDPRIIDLTIPDTLKAAGLSVYQLALKVNLYARYQADANWRVRISQAVELVSPPLTPNPTNFPNTPGIPDLIYDGGTSTV